MCACGYCSLNWSVYGSKWEEAVMRALRSSQGALAKAATRLRISYTTRSGVLPEDDVFLIGSEVGEDGFNLVYRQHASDPVTLTKNCAEGGERYASSLADIRPASFKWT